MKFFKLFSRKKSHSEKIERIFEELENDQDYVGFSDFEESEYRQHFVFDKCDQMIECAHEMEIAKAEYDNITAYLMDIDLIENMPEVNRKIINNLAERIDLISKDRQEYKAYAAKLADPKYAGVRKYEEDFPLALERLRENEKYQAIVKHDINFIQGEKSAIAIQIEKAKSSNESMRKSAKIIPFIFIPCLIAAFFLKIQLGWDITLLLCGIILVAAIAASAILLKLQNNNEIIKKEYASLNHAIILLNKMKTKYVNATNAVEYAYEKYIVNSAYELEYLWNEYSSLKRERDKHNQTTGDIEYYSLKLSNELSRYDINYPDVWPNQAEALINPNEMVEIRHMLNQRRQKLRSRLEHNADMTEKLKMDILEAVAKNPEYSDEVLEMVKSIDSKQVI